MFSNLLDMLFGCTHKNCTFPITTRARSVQGSSTYVVCLDCGKEFPYDWEQMKLGSSAPALQPLPAAVPISQPEPHWNKAA